MAASPAGSPSCGGSWQLDWAGDRHPPRPPTAYQEEDARKMTELTIRPEEIRDALARFVEAYEPGAAATEEVGTVVECGDGIARVEGLPSAMANELLEFEDGTRG